MSKILIVLQTVHQTVHQFSHLTHPALPLKKKYSTPTIYAGGATKPVKKLTMAEKRLALSKDWYIYYKYLDKDTGKLKRMPNIKAGVNRFKTVEERWDYLKILRDTLELLLQRGGDPTGDNDIDQLLGTNTEKPQRKPEILEVHKPVETPDSNEPAVMSIEEAFAFALKIKQNSTSENSYRNFELRIKRFEKSLDKNQPITSVKRQVVNGYLNKILDESSPRNRNNTRIDLSSLFQVLHDNEIITENFISKINVLKSKPERNKTYTPQLQNDIFEYLEAQDPLLLLFIKFVSYNFLRPVEVCRLKIKDIDVKDKRLYVRAKNKAVKIKIIPDILLEELPLLSELPQDNLLISSTGIGEAWDATENNRRDHFSKRFKEVVKDHFKLGIDYGMYSFRHTYITKLYRKLRETYSPYDTKNRLMLITGHSTMSALEKYLRDIDAELPEDYSDLLR